MLIWRDSLRGEIMRLRILCSGETPDPEGWRHEDGGGVTLPSPAYLACWLGCPASGSDLSWGLVLIAAGHFKKYFLKGFEGGEKEGDRPPHCLQAVCLGWTDWTYRHVLAILLTRFLVLKVTYDGKMEPPRVIALKR